MSRLTLASASPQRRAILTRLGIDFDVRPAGMPERESGPATEVAIENALAKARASSGDVVLGVDTVVSLDGRLYGKPADAQDAEATLRALGGRTHEVVSAIALVRGGIEETVWASTEVEFRPLDEALVRWYVALGEWRDRAGGYAIQGAGCALVRAVRGDYENVVGLPVAAMLDRWPELLLRSSSGSAA